MIETPQKGLIERLVQILETDIAQGVLLLIAIGVLIWNL